MAADAFRDIFFAMRDDSFPAFGERAIRRGLRVNIIAGSFGMMFIAVAIGVPITMLFERLGASGAQMGLLVTVQQLAMLAQIPAALFAGRLASRKAAFASLALAHRALWFLPALLPLLLQHRPEIIVWTILGAMTLSSLLAQASAPLWFSWISDLVPERESGHFWGRRQSVVTLFFLVMTGVAGWLLDAFRGNEGAAGLAGFAIVFGLGALFGVTDIVIHLWVPEPPVRGAPVPAPWWRALIEPLRNADFRRLTIVIGLWLFSLGLIGSFGMVYLKREFGATYAQLSAIAIASSLGAVVASAALGLLLDRVGARSVGAFLLFAAPLTSLVWWLVSPRTLHFSLLGRSLEPPQSIVLIAAASVVSGALYSGVGLCHMKLLGALAPQGPSRTTAMAIHWTLAGLLGAAGPWLGGKILDLFPRFDPGWPLPFGGRWGFIHALLILHALVCWLGAAPMILRIRRRADDLPFGALMARLRPGNPLRAVTLLYDLWANVSADSVSARTRAIRRLGRRRAALAVRDLIRQLDDPSAEVREAAAISLGQIGGDEAVAALIEELRDLHTDLSSASARALRRARDPRSVDALLAALETADRETAAESARALGAIGDRRAADALRETLRKTRDAKLLAASGEALAQLGAIEAIYDILPRIKSATNPVLRRALSVAVGDLLGEPGEFYRILAREEAASGSEVERMLRDIRRRIEPRRSEDSARDGTIAALIAPLAEIQDAYDAERIADGARSLQETGRALAILFPAPFTRDAAGHAAEHAKITRWFLDLLGQPWAERDLGHRDRTDLLLGVYALHALVRALEADETG